MWEGQAGTAKCSSLCCKRPWQLHPALLWLILIGRVGAVGFELAESRERRIFEGRPALSSPFLALCQRHLLQIKKQGTRSWLVCMTGLFPGLGFWLALKQRNEKSNFSPLRFMMRGREVVLGGAAAPAGLSLRHSAHSFGSTMLFLPYSYFKKLHSWIQVLNWNLVWSNTEGHWRRKAS